MTDRIATDAAPAMLVARLRARLARFRQARSGAVAIEFGIVALPFFSLLFATFEMSYLFLAGQAFDTSLDSAARQLLTGQAQGTTGAAAINSQATFIQYALCPRLPAMITCPGAIQVNVAQIADFTGATFSPPVSNGQLQTSSWGYNPCLTGKIVKVEAIAPVNALTSFWLSPYTITSNGTKQRVLYASTVFRCEPY